MRKWVDKAAEIIVDLYDPDTIILFGSYVKGTDNVTSDIDLLIVKDTDIPRYYRGIEVLEALSRYPIRFDLLFYTNDEVKAGLAREFSFIHSIVGKGKYIYEKT